MTLINEASIPIPSRMIIIKNKATKLGEEAFKEILPETFKTHAKAEQQARDFIKKCHLTDYRSDARIIKTAKYGQMVITFTQFYWYKGLSPEVSVVSFAVSHDNIDVYDYIVDTKVFSKEISKKYHTKVSPKTSIPISANNTEEQKKFPNLVELGNFAKKYFLTLPIIQDQSYAGMGNEMSFLILPEDNKRLYDYQFFLWNQWVEGEYYAKKNFLAGYDVYRGANSLKDDSIMIYVLKNKKPAPVYQKKYFNIKNSPIPVWGKEEMDKLQGKVKDYD